LGMVDAILAEDTRVTLKLLQHLELATPLERCDENVIRRRSEAVIGRLAAGENLAYVTDAGTPGVSDPGSFLVSAARAAGIQVEVLPGPSSVLAALVASGFYAPSFYFGGFLPRKNGEKTALLEQLAPLQAVLVFFESPHRFLSSLQTVSMVYPDRLVCMARELTKMHEEVIVDYPEKLLGLLNEKQDRGQALKGETVLLIDAPPKPAGSAHIDRYSSQKDDAQHSAPLAGIDGASLT